MVHSLLLILLLTVNRGHTPDVRASLARKAVESFRDHLQRNDAQAAFKMMAPLPAIPADRQEKTKQELEAWVKRHAKAVSEGKWDFKVADAKESGDYAVAVIIETVKDGKPAFGIDPMYLVRKDNEWKLLKGTYKAGAYGFTKEQLAAYGKLEEWYRSRAEELHKKDR